MPDRLRGIVNAPFFPQPTRDKWFGGTPAFERFDM
jgi:hypothetical protein